MKYRILVLTLLVTTTILVTQCTKENVDNQNTNELITTISGNLKDEFNENVSNATLSINGVNVNTNSDGNFVFNKIKISKNAVIIAKKDGYFDNYKTLQITKGANHFVQLGIFKKVETQNFSATKGGAVGISNQLSVEFQPNSIVYENGNNYDGIVNVDMKFLNPSKNSNLIPGSNLGIDANQKEVVLKSYGLAGVELRGVNNEKLQIKTGEKAKLKIAISTKSTAPSSVKLSYFDAKSGYWKEEGTATKEGNYFVGSVGHFSYWNCVQQFELININGVIKDNSDIPVLSKIEVIDPIDSVLFAYGYTEQDGTFEGKLPKNMQVSLIINHLSTCNYSKYGTTVGPYSQDTDLGILKTNIDTKLLKISGTVKDCNNSVLKGALVHLILGNSIYVYDKQVVTDDNGSYSFDFPNCNGYNYKVVSIDNINNKVSQIIPLTVNKGIIQKDITVCENLDMVEINGIIQSENGSLLNGTKINLTNLNDTIPIQSTFSNNGKFSFFVNKNIPLKLRMYQYTNCGQVEFSKEIGPFTQNTNIGIVTVVFPSNNQLFVHGILTDCNGAVVTNGVVRYTTNNFTKYTFSDNNGAYALNIDNCQNDTYNLTAFDEQNNKFSNSFTISGVGDITKNFNVCNTSDEYLQIQSGDPILDNTIFQNIYVTDSLNYLIIYASENTKNENVSFSMKALIDNNTGSAVKLNFFDPKISINNLGNNVSLNTINLQAFPVSLGDYYIGNFTINGVTNNYTNKSMNLTGNFKIKKKN